MKKITTFTILLMLLASAAVGVVTPAEIVDIEAAFDITLTAEQIQQLDADVNPTNSPAWLSDAQVRIEQHRKSDLTIRVEDANGDTVESAQVSVSLKRNAFDFGGTFSSKDFSGVGSSLMTMSTDTYKQRLLSLFNAVGLNNGFKPRLVNLHQYLPSVKSWAADNELPLRGHLLIWPGNNAKNHLTETVLAAVQAVEAALTNGSSQAVIDGLRDDLRTTVSNEMVSWAAQHDVVEWDVINEPLGNRRVQDALDDYDVMAEWFEIAESNKVSADCRLFINEFQIISAMTEELTPGYYTSRRDRYMTEVNRLLTNNAPIDGIGFQSRIKAERRDPQLIYDRLDEWATTYPNLRLIGTEFEVKDSAPEDTWKTYQYTDEERAQITAEMMTQYYSHPQVDALTAWNIIGNDTSQLVNYDGVPTRNGLVWYYMHRHRYNTEAELASGIDGQTRLSAYEGDYDVAVRYKGEELSSSVTLSSNQLVVITIPSQSDGIDGNSTIVDAWDYNDLPDGTGLGSATSTGGIFFPDYDIASIQHGTLRWQSDGTTDSYYRQKNLSQYTNASNGVFQLSVDFLDADFTASSELTNGLGRIQFVMRDSSGVDTGIRLLFSSGNGNNPTFRLEATDDLGANQTLTSFSGTTLDHLNVRAVFDLNNRGSSGSFKVYYRHEGGAEVLAYTGQLPTDFDLGQLRYAVQTYNGGCNWAAGDRIHTDNLILRKFDESPAPGFTTNLISKSDATMNTPYTDQTLFGSATNALSYSKIMGPTWLSVAADGTLSGTPSSDDTGANSWIVQVSNGIDTDTAILKINVTGTGTAIGSNISIADLDTTGFSSGTGSVTGTLGNGIVAQEGDMIVIAAATNKKGDVAPISLVQSGGTGSTAVATLLSNAMGTYPTSWIWYMPVTTAGTFSYELTASRITASATLYILRAGSGTIELAGSASWDDNNNADNGTTYSLDYTFEDALPAGLLIEAISARTDSITKPTAYTEDANAVNKRITASYNQVAGTSWASAYALSGGTANKQTSGAAGAIFVEITSGGAPRPVFNSDPVVELRAIYDQPYTGSNLADHVLNTTAPSFAKISGPDWLSLASNGTLSGIPTVADIGTNRWQVMVAEGGITNFANLHIAVETSAPPVASPDRSRLLPTNTYNVLFIAIDDMRPLINAYGETEPLQPITPQMDRLAESGVMFANAHCQQAVCNASRASMLTGLRPDTTQCWNLSTFFRDKLPNVITLPQHFGDNGYHVHGIGKIYHSTNPTSQDDPLSWNEGWVSSATAYRWYEAAKAVGEDGGNNKISATDAGEINTRDGNRPVVDADYNDGYAAELAVAKIADYAAGLQTNDTPFFLGVGFQKPHMPFNCPKTYWDLYDENDIDLTGYTGIRQMPAGSNKFTAPYGGEPNAFDDVTGTSDNGMPDATEARHLIHGYLACVSFIDTQIGKLLDALDDPDGNPETDDSIAENTIIVLWSDHGFHLGDHNGFWAKHSNYEISTRVPVIVRVPGMTELGSAGSRCTGLIELVDIYPTLVDLCSLPAPNQPPGQSLQGTTFLPLIEDPAQPWKKAVFSQFQRTIKDTDPGDTPVNNAGSGMGYSIRTARYRYTEWWVTDSTDETDRHLIKSGITEPGFVELYDYLNDPGETVNLATNTVYESLMTELSGLLNDANAISAGDGWSLSETTAPTAYPLDPETWKSRYLAPGHTLSELDFNADPDGDGIVNRLEYKYGTHPFEANENIAEAGLVGGSLQVTYREVEARSGVQLRPVTTTDLLDSWSDSGVTVTENGETGHATIKTGSVSTNDTQRFLGLEAIDL